MGRTEVDLRQRYKSRAGIAIVLTESIRASYVRVRPLSRVELLLWYEVLRAQETGRSRSEIQMRSLSMMAGLERVGLHMGRVPPGKESFVYHRHQCEEEFVYILSGRGLAEIGDETHEAGPGDAMLFTAPSVGHHLRNPFDEDLV